MRVKLSDHKINSLEAGVYMDSELCNFGVRISPKGKKTFIIDLTNNGKRIKKAVGQAGLMTTSVARQIASRLITEIKYEDGLQKFEVNKKYSINEVCDMFVKRHFSNLKDSTKVDYVRHIQCIKAKFGKRTEVSKREITDWYYALKKENVFKANRTLSTFSSILSKGITWDLWKENPIPSIEKVKEKSRDQRIEIKSFAEILKFVKDNLDDRSNLFFRILFTTASRRGEILNMRKKDVIDGVWIKPDETMKNKKPHIIKLDKETFRVFNEYTCTLKPDSKVFPSFWPQAQWVKIRDKFGLTGLRMHDIRRSVATGLLSSGTPIEEVSSLLSHSDISITQKVYAEYITDHGESVNKVIELMDDKLSNEEVEKGWDAVEKEIELEESVIKATLSE